MADHNSTRTPPGGARRQVPLDPRLGPQAERPRLGLISAIAGWAGGTVVMAALLWWMVLRSPNAVIIGMLGLGGAGIVFWVIANFTEMKRAAAERRFQTSLNSTAFSLFVLGILVLLNFVVYRHNTVKDMTSGHLYSLSEQTVATLSNLKDDVQFLVFMSGNDTADGQRLLQRFDEYRRYTRRLKVEIKNPFDERELVKQYSVVALAPVQGMPAAKASVVVVCGDRHDTVIGAEEADLTNAIIQVTTEDKPRVYFLLGDGEYSLDAVGPDDLNLSNLKAVLQGQQYQVESLVLAKMKQPQIPADCKVLVIAGAMRPLSPAYMKAIKNYVDNNGKLLLALSCGIADLKPGATAAPDFKEVLTSRGVQAMRGLVVDQDSFQAGMDIPAITHFEDQPIVQSLQLVAMPTACALKIKETPPPPAYPGTPAPPPQKVQPLLRTSARSWLETSLDRSKMGPGPGNAQGPLVLGAAVDEGASPAPDTAIDPTQRPLSSGPATRIVVFGDADFMTNRYSQMQLRDNQELAAKSIAWLAARQNLVSIPAKKIPDRSLTMKRSQKLAATIVCLFLIPAAIIVAGTLVWALRRKG